MHIVARYLLWILIAVLPMQGSAAAFMALAASPAGRAQAAMQAGHCGQAKASGDHAVASSDAADEAGNMHAKCSSCASCCIGAYAPPFDTLNPVPPPQLNDALVLREPAMTAFISATLERPPRQHA